MVIEHWWNVRPLTSHQSEKANSPDQWFLRIVAGLRFVEQVLDCGSSQGDRVARSQARVGEMAKADAREIELEAP